MQWQKALFGERSLTKVAGLFVDRASAETAASQLLDGAGFAPTQVRLLGPEVGNLKDRDLLARQVEPEQHGIWRTILRAHLTMGLLGFVAGTLLFAGWWLSGDAAIRTTPGMAWVSMAGFGATFGLLLGGLLSMRPDHGRVISRVRRALRLGRWAVVVHPVSAEQTQLALTRLRPISLRVLRSF